VGSAGCDGAGESTITCLRSCCLSVHCTAAAALSDGISGFVVEVVMADIRAVGCRSAIWTGVPLIWTASCTVNQQRMGWLDRAPSAFLVSRAFANV
jgi:hypothetical protein